MAPGQAEAWQARWDQHPHGFLSLIAGLPANTNARPEDDGMAVADLSDLFPTRGYAITRPDGSTTHLAGPLLKPLQKGAGQDLIRNNSSTTAKALKGISSSGALAAPYATAPCLASSVPPYNIQGPEQGITGATPSFIDLELGG